MKTTHTPGPWYTGINDDDSDKVFQDGSGVAIMSGGRRSQAERDANARLIAAAPDLLAFAIECARADSDCGEAVRDAARAAIAKAKGPA